MLSIKTLRVREALAKPTGIENAMVELAILANRYHRSQDTAKAVIDIALPELCRAIIEQTAMTAAQRVDHALDRCLPESVALSCCVHLL